MLAYKESSENSLPDVWTNHSQIEVREGKVEIDYAIYNLRPIG